MRLPKVGDIIRHNGTHARHVFKGNECYYITEVHSTSEQDPFNWRVYTNAKPDEWFFYGYFTHVSSKQAITLSEL